MDDVANFNVFTNVSYNKQLDFLHLMGEVFTARLLAKSLWNVACLMLLLDK